MSKIIYYTDLDFVIVQYSKVFFEKAYNMGYDIDLRDVEECLIKKIEHMDSPISYYYKKIKMTKDDILLCVEYADKENKVELTDFGKTLIKYLKNKINSGYEVVVVTARNYSRKTVDEIVKNIFGIKIPVITCNTEYKHYVVSDKGYDYCIYFEDNPIAIKKVASNISKKSKIFVPEWPWNKKEISEFSKKYRNVILVKNNDINFDFEGNYNGK